MAISVTSLGTAAPKTGTEISVLNSTAFSVGDFIIACLSADTDVVGTLLSSGAWSAGGNLGTAVQQLAGCGTQTAGLSFGGRTGSISAVTEEYDGAAWSAGGSLATARYALAGCGTQTAGLSFGGSSYSAVTEEYDGAAWSAGGNLGAGIDTLAGCGTQTAGLSFGGFTGAYSAVTEEYDGAAWSAGGNLGTARNNLAGCGTQTAGLSFGGWTGAYSAVTEEYDGAAWSAGGSLATARYALAGCGTQTAGLSFGGYSISAVEEYNGVAWAAGGSLATARSALAGCGTQTAGLSFGGYNTDALAVTEEYDGAIIDTTNEAITGTNSANVLVRIMYARYLSAGTGGNYIKITGLTSEAHAATFYLASGLSATPLDKTISATGTGTSQSSGATATLSQADELVIGAAGTEDSGDAGDLKGSWTTGANNVSGNEQQIGTTGGGDASNVNIYTAAEIVSATTAQTAAHTGTDSVDWAAVIATFKGIVISSLITPAKQIRNYIRM